MRTMSAPGWAHPVNLLGRTCIVVITVIGLVAIATQHAGALDIEKRNLFSLCAPLNVVSEPLRDDLARKIGLTGPAIERVLESKLDAVQLFDADSNEFLSARVSLGDAGDFFSVEVGLNRFVGNMGYGIGGIVTLWTTRTLGHHGGSPQVILQAVAALTDEFLGHYLYVNEAECQARKDASGDWVPALPPGNPCGPEALRDVPDSAHPPVLSECKILFAQAEMAGDDSLDADPSNYRTVPDSRRLGGRRPVRP